MVKECQYSLSVISFMAFLLCLSLFLEVQEVLAADGQQASRLGKGVFLVATDKMRDPRFRKSVILLTKYSPQSAAGLIINRPSKLSLSKALPMFEGIRDDVDQVFMGGPVSLNNVFLLIKTDRAHNKLKHVIDNIFTTVGVRALTHIISVLAPHEHLRAYTGFSGWAPGQLDIEVAHGSWLVVPADIDLIYSSNPEDIWKKLNMSWQGQWI
jgi:putative transcriptional regulator